MALLSENWTLLALLTPSCWTQNYNYDEDLDAWLNRCIDNEMPIRVLSKYNAEVDGVSLWIANHPYASFTTKRNGVTVRPSRATILRAMAYMKSGVQRGTPRATETSLSES